MAWPVSLQRERGSDGGGQRSLLPVTAGSSSLTHAESSAAPAGIGSPRRLSARSTDTTSPPPACTPRPDQAPRTARFARAVSGNPGNEARASADRDCHAANGWDGSESARDCANFCERSTRTIASGKGRTSGAQSRPRRRSSRASHRGSSAWDPTHHGRTAWHGCLARPQPARQRGYGKGHAARRGNAEAALRTIDTR